MSPSPNMVVLSSGLSSDWALLPADILGAILDKLVDISDRVRTRAVCKSCLSTFQDNNKEWLKSGASQLPMLLIPTEGNSETHRGLFSVAGSRILRTRLHVPYNKRCCGSSHGWLIFAEEDLSLALFNPFSGETIRLPQVIPVPTKKEIGTGFYRHEYQIRKVVLSKDPSSNPHDYEVLALCGFDLKSLAMFRAGGESWSRRESGEYQSLTYSFQDITYFKGKFYAVNNKGLLSVKLDHKACIRLRTITRRRTGAPYIQQYYLVGCGDSLLWIERNHVKDHYEGNYSDDSSDTDDSDYDPFNYGLGQESNTGYFEIDGCVYGYCSGIHHLTKSFTVCMLTRTEAGKLQIIKTQHLDGHAVFVGDNLASTVLASDFPGCRPNCIYYMDDWNYRPANPPFGAIDIGFFDVEDQRARPLCVPGISQWHLPPPIWIVPQANRATVL